MNGSGRFRLRIVLPAFSHFNIYTSVAKITTALGPLCVASAANKLERWDVEIIDENNCRSRVCPKDDQGRPDHFRIQKQRPANVVGFYGSMSSTAPRLYELASLYRRLGAWTVAGGKHVENMPGEALANGLDVVVLGEGELTVQELLEAWQADGSLNHVDGIAFKQNGTTHTTAPRPLITSFCELPQPDFSLLLYARMRIYPIGRIRGCNMNCEFCAVKERARYASPCRTRDQIVHLVETARAKKFFEVSDHFAADRESALEFCRMLATYQAESGRRFTMTVQIRISDADDEELLQAMKAAGINNLAIGYESPIDRDLRTMRKGYLSRDMIRWTHKFHEHGFFIHGMFIFGYPRSGRPQPEFTVSQRISRFRDFLLTAKIDTVQILLPVPLPGTDLRKRLQSEARLYPGNRIGWQYYDGQFPLFEPDNGSSPEELQQAVTQIMGRFYRFRHFWRMIASVLVHFPRIVFLASLSIVTFRVKFIVRAFLRWKKLYFRNDLIRFGGYLVLKSWLKNFRNDNFLQSLAVARQQLRLAKKRMKAL